MEFEKMKRKLLIAEKKIRNLEDLLESNTRDLFIFNQELISKNKQNDILLKEVHHRVKNNLQIITGLLSLQSCSIEDIKLKSIFRDSHMRINSIALAHEMFYQTESLSKINYQNYIHDLACTLSSTFNQNKEISIKVDCSGIFFNIETAVPLGLLINEILTNSFKYGFNSKNGEVSIKIKKHLDTNDFTLKIGDNGIDLTEENASKKNSLGLKLIKKLSKQLSAKFLTDKNKKGTNYVLKFKEIQSKVLKLNN